MKLAIMLLCVACVVAQTQPGSAQPAQAQAQRPKATVAGKVSNALTGETLRKASVMLVSAGGRGQQARTAISDEQGAFAFTGVEPGSYRLFAVRTGFVRQSYGDRDPGSYVTSGTVLNIKTGQEIKDVLIRLQPAAAISGRVVDQDGDALMQVRVQALRWNYHRGRRQLMPAGSDQSNDRGEYRIYDLPPGRYYLSATYEGGFVTGYLAGMGVEVADQAYVPVFYPGVNDPAQAAPVVVRGGEEVPGINLTVIPQRAVAISGRVSNAVTGQVGRGVHVSLMARSLTMRAFITGDQDTNTDEQGAFRFRGIAPGPYIVVAEWDAEGDGPGKIITSGNNQTATYYNRRHYSARQWIDVGGADLEGVNLVIAPGVDISGTVKVEGTLPPPTPTRNETSDSVVMGTRVMRSTSSGAPMRIMLDGAEDVSLGTVTTPLKPDNTFVLENVPDGTYRVNVGGLPGNAYIKSARMAGQDVLEDGLVVTRGRRGALELVVSTLTGRVEGTVRDGDTRFPGARVVLVPEGGRRSLPNRYRLATSDENGDFVLASIPPGDYKLFAWDAIEAGAYQDPEFLRVFEDRGVAVRVTESGHSSAEVKVIVTEERSAQ